MAQIAETFENIAGVFSTQTDKPDLFLEVQDGCAKKLRSNIKQLYDCSRSNVEDGKCGDALPELIIEDFDDEQIWQEIELKNEPSVKDLLSRLVSTVSGNTVSFEEELGLVNDKEQILEEQGNSGGDDRLESPVEQDEEDSEGSESDRNWTLDGNDTDELSEEEQQLERLLDIAAAQDGGEMADGSSDDKYDEEEEDEEGEGDLREESFLPPGNAEKQKTSSFDAKQSKFQTKRKTIVDDQFFHLSDMEMFLDKEDLKEERKHQASTRLKKNSKRDGDDDGDDDDEEDIDVFAELPSDDDKERAEGRYMAYAEFFDPPEGEAPEPRKKVKFAAEQSALDAISGKASASASASASDSDAELDAGDGAAVGAGSSDEGETAEDVLGGSGGEAKSSFELRQERLKKKIAELEEAALSEKPWQLTGEVSATARPENSLLQEDLDFEHTTKLPPVITEETTQTIEDLIKQRIRDKAWDDVQRKVKKTEDPFEYKKRIVLDQEKSKLGLSEIYEREYLKQQQKEEEEKPDPDHSAIQASMQSLFVKLDALSNFHYTPKPAAPEIQITSNLPTITMEEVAPVTASGGTTLLAPQEIQGPEKAETKGDAEKSKGDKNRERRKKKKRQKLRERERLKKQELKEKMNPGLAKKQSTAAAMRELEKKSKSNKSLTIVKDKSKKASKLTSSTAFFSQLQDEVTSHISGKKAEKRKKLKQKSKSAGEFKL